MGVSAPGPPQPEIHGKVREQLSPQRFGALAAVSEFVLTGVVMAAGRQRRAAWKHAAVETLSQMGMT